MQTKSLSVSQFYEMLANGYRNLKRNMTTIDELNVFPVPDGDTGKNMTATIGGGVGGTNADFATVGDMMKAFSRASLLSARGNSGVILSQFIRGLSEGSQNVETYDVGAFKKAMASGKEYSYKSVAVPTEGTILTLIREGSDYINAREYDCFEDCFSDLITELHRSLQHTPELLPVLKEAGVVDSGGAGFLCVIEGMKAYLDGEIIEEDSAPASPSFATTTTFGEDSTLEYGYCTEFILQLLNSKTNIQTFSLARLTERLQGMGDSVVTVQDGSLVKVHVHTFAPEEVLGYVRRYGEFVTLKIENMSVQHSEIEAEKKKEHYKFAVVAVATGEGILHFFKDVGVTEVIDGGRTNNPSAEDFIEAFEKFTADHIIVLPNDSNVILTAKQAAELYKASDVRVIPTRSLAEGYSALSMMNLVCDTVEEAIESMSESLPNVSTGYVTTATRDALFDGVSIKKDDWIGIENDTIRCASDNPVDAAMQMFANMENIEDKQVVTAFYGYGATEEEVEQLQNLFCEQYPLIEIGFIRGDQDVYRYIFAIE